MLFWTKEEYQKFAEEMMDKPVSYYAFQMLYWTGIREGELLALTPADFDFERGTVKISKTYQRLKGQDVITSPKTKKKQPHHSDARLSLPGDAGVFQNAVRSEKERSYFHGNQKLSPP